MKKWDIIYQYCDTHPDCTKHGMYVISPQPKQPLWSSFTASYIIDVRRLLGFAFLALGMGGMLGPMIPTIRLEAGYALRSLKTKNQEPRTLPKSVPVAFEPLTTPDGATIDPINQEFALVVPKIGVNAPVIANVDPAKPGVYKEALETGVAHASTSFFPDEDGTVYLFSHSTNYDWFVKDLNAVFYLLKNLDNGDTVVLVYKGKRYTYKITDKRVVSPKSTSYLYPYVGRRNLILQTCWPPGSTAERLLIFAELIEEQGKQI